MEPKKFSVDWYKKKINLAHFMLSYDGGKHAQLMSSGSENDPKIKLINKEGEVYQRCVLYTRASDQCQFYMILGSRQAENKGKSIIDFVQTVHKTYYKKHLTYKHTLYLLKKFLENPKWNISDKAFVPPKYGAKINFNSFYGKYVTKELENTEYLELRHWKKSTYEHPLFKGVIVNHNYQEPETQQRYSNIAYKFRKIEIGGIPGQVIGISSKNKKELSAGKDFKKAYGEKSKGLVTSNVLNRNKLKYIHCFESFDDAISYYQLNEKNINPEEHYFISIEGTAGFEQWESIRAIVYGTPATNVHIPFDNDLEGHKNKVHFLSTIIHHPYSLSFDLDKDNEIAEKASLKFTISSSNLEESQELSRAFKDHVNSINFNNLAEDNSEQIFKIKEVASETGTYPVFYNIDHYLEFPGKEQSWEQLAELFSEYINPKLNLNIDLSCSYQKDYTDDLDMKFILDRKNNSRLR